MTPTYWRDEVVLDRRVALCAWTTLALNGLLAVVTGIAIGIPHENWASIPPWLAYSLSELSMLIPGAIVITAMRALPQAQDIQTTTVSSP